MLKENEFKWQIRYANNIPGNPLECEFCIVDYGNGKGKMYAVEPFYPQNTDGVTDKTGGYKYFLFFACDVRLPTEKEKEDFFLDWSTYAGYIITSKTFIAVFDSMGDPKKRAYTQYRHHFGYVLAHIVDDIEKETQKHFVVQ